MTDHDEIAVAADRARYACAAAAADDPDGLMDAATEVYKIMVDLVEQGLHREAAGAAVGLGDACLLLCAAPTLSDGAALNKCLFLRSLATWAWPREPALGAVMDAAIEAECRTWPACRDEMLAVDREP